MDFEKTINVIVKEFDKEKVNYGLIGGFAMGALGIMRATMDLDFLVEYKDIPKVEKIMEKYGYKCVFKSENASQYISSIKIFGEIDFLHAFRKISVSMLKRAEEIMVFENKFRIRVLCPEDIIGLKLQSSINNTARQVREYADIENIMDYFKRKLDWSLLKEYFCLFDRELEYKNLKSKYGNSK